MKHYIYMHQPFNLDKGGSVGYVSYLYDAYCKHNNNFITNDNIKIEFTFPKENVKNDILNSVLDKRLLYTQSYPHAATRHLLTQRQNYFKEIIPSSEENKINPNDITSIHIHGAYNFFPIYNSLIKMGVESRVIKMLTTHNPYQPMLEDMYLTCRTVKWLEHDKQMFKYYFSERDKWAFTLADCLFFPTEESMEGYYQSWPEFRNIIKNKPVYFASTGSEIKTVHKSARMMKEELNIPNDAKVLLYMGRFIDVRGFDILVQVAKNILKKYKNIYFIIVGENIDIPVNSNRWIQLPFTNDPGSFINMADACLCPNRGSLFDLSMIEILSLGKPIICSYVGGYKWLKNKTDGIIYSEPGDVISYQNAIEEFLLKSNEQIGHMGRDNFEAYNKLLTLSHFEKGYSKAVDAMYHEFYNNRQIHKISYCNMDIAQQVNFVNINTNDKSKINMVNQKNNIFYKKIKKLIRNPKLFIQDFMYKRRINNAK